MRKLAEISFPQITKTMGCRTHRLRCKSGEPCVNGHKIKLSLKSAKSADNAVKATAIENDSNTSDSDASEETDDPWSVKDILIASQIVKGPSFGECSATRYRFLEKNCQRSEFRLPKLQFIDLMVSKSL